MSWTADFNHQVAVTSHIFTSLSVVGSERKTHLQEARDVPLVADAHGHHILEEPEERAVITLLGPSLVQQAVELEEQTTGALCEERRQLREMLRHCLACLVALNLQFHHTVWV